MKKYKGVPVDAQALAYIKDRGYQQSTYRPTEDEPRSRCTNFWLVLYLLAGLEDQQLSEKQVIEIWPDLMTVLDFLHVCKTTSEKKIPLRRRIESMPNNNLKKIAEELEKGRLSP